MKERPILFSTDMVNALLDGRKTQTRRIIKPSFPSKQGLISEVHSPWNHNESNVWQWQTGKANVNYSDDERRCPYGMPGDVLWVREAFRKVAKRNDVTGKISYHFIHKAGFWNKDTKGWKPSIHMPKEACRIRLKITDVRVERLQDISVNDAIQEGYKKFRSGSRNMTSSRIDQEHWEAGAMAWFIRLWKEINGDESWNENPWLWVVEFEVISTTGKPVT